MHINPLHKHFPTGGTMLWFILCINMIYKFDQNIQNLFSISIYVTQMRSYIFNS